MDTRKYGGSPRQPDASRQRKAPHIPRLKHLGFTGRDVENHLYALAKEQRSLYHCR